MRGITLILHVTFLSLIAFFNLNYEAFSQTRISTWEQLLRESINFENKYRRMCNDGTRACYNEKLQLRMEGAQLAENYPLAGQASCRIVRIFQEKRSYTMEGFDAGLFNSAFLCRAEWGLLYVSNISRSCSFNKYKGDPERICFAEKLFINDEVHIVGKAVSFEEIGSEQNRPSIVLVIGGAFKNKDYGSLSIRLK